MTDRAARTAGTVLVGAVLVVASAGIYALSRRSPVTAADVTAADVTEMPVRRSITAAARAAA